jgi:excisionase family DNA binding protein
MSDRENCFDYFEYFVYFVLFGIKCEFMKAFESIRKPSKHDQKVAGESYSALASVIEKVRSDQPEIEVEESKDRIKIPLSALKLLGDILKAMSQGKLISIVPVATEMTTQAAAEILGCSRPHIVKLLEDGRIAYSKIGKHRRIQFEDVMKYKKQMKDQQKQNIIDIMKMDEEAGLYDS